MHVFISFLHSLTLYFRLQYLSFVSALFIDLSDGLSIKSVFIFLPWIYLIILTFILLFKTTMFTVN